MGDLGTSPEGIGGWARVYGSEQAHDGIDMKNASVQVGADADVGMGWKAGAAFSYTDGSSDMTAGSADHKACGLAAYGTWLGEGGHFVEGNLPRNESQGVHTVDDLVVTARRPKSEKIKGFMNSTEIFRVMAEALALGH